ncbi:MAG: hypothetical protein Q9177_005108 [Variospora cf. flavescens]
MDYWAIPVVSLVMFTLYGIDGIGSQLEDPFGYDRNDIKMDFIVEDIRSEISVLLEEWKRAGQQGYDMFVGKRPDSGGQVGNLADVNERTKPEGMLTKVIPYRSSFVAAAGLQSVHASP